MILIFYSTKPLLRLLGHQALVWMVGFTMAGFMLSGSGIRVFKLGNMGSEWSGCEKAGNYIVYVGVGRGSSNMLYL